MVGDKVMRAKMRVDSVLSTEYGDKIEARPVAKKGSYPESGHDEDNSFAKFSPSGALELQIANPALIGKIKPGQVYYLDFTLAEEAPAAAGE